MWIIQILRAVGDLEITYNVSLKVYINCNVRDKVRDNTVEVKISVENF